MAKSGIVTQLSGTAIAINASGVACVLKVGDKVFPNDIIQTSDGSSVIIEFGGSPIVLGRSSSVLLDEEFFNFAPDAMDQETIEKMIADGKDLTTELEATAAGPSSHSEGGHSFVVMQPVTFGGVVVGYDTSTAAKEPEFVFTPTYQPQTIQTAFTEIPTVKASTVFVIQEVTDESNTSNGTTEEIPNQDSGHTPTEDNTSPSPTQENQPEVQPIVEVPVVVQPEPVPPQPLPVEDNEETTEPEIDTPPEVVPEYVPVVPRITDFVDVHGNLSKVTMLGTGDTKGNTISLYDEDNRFVGSTIVKDDKTWEIDVSKLKYTPDNDNEFFHVTETHMGGEVLESQTVHYWHGSWSNAETEASDDYALMGTGTDTIYVNDDDANNFVVIDGGVGKDTAVFNFKLDASSIRHADGTVTINEANGDVNEIRNVETFKFSDKTVSVDQLRVMVDDVLEKDKNLFKDDKGPDTHAQGKNPHTEFVYVDHGKQDDLLKHEEHIVA